MYEEMFDSFLKVNRLHKYLPFVDGLYLNGTLQATISCWYQTKIKH